jgi:hypothetical protein
VRDLFVPPVVTSHDQVLEISTVSHKLDLFKTELLAWPFAAEVAAVTVTFLILGCCVLQMLSILKRAMYRNFEHHERTWDTFGKTTEEIDDPVT